MTDGRVQHLMLKSNTRRARVTGADLHYKGRIAVDKAPMEAADRIPNERVHVLNSSNGARAETYVIPGRRNSGDTVLIGEFAGLAQVIDPVIILPYACRVREAAERSRPALVSVDGDNRLQGDTG